MQNWEATTLARIGARSGQGIIWGAVCLCAVGALYIHVAQAESIGTAPASLDGGTLAPSSAEACSASSIDPASRSFGTQAARDTSCYISAKSIRASIESIVVVDVRPPGEFEQFHIDGAANIAVHAIKTKPFLRQKSLVLVDRGAVQLPLEEQCARLKAEGYRVSVLKGGLKAWNEQSGSFSGAAPDALSLSTISPSELYEASHAERWLMVVSKTNRPVAENFSAVAMNIDPANRESAERNLRKLKALQLAKGSRVIVANADGENYRAIEELVRKFGLKDVWYLAGGVRGYASFLTDHAAMLERLDSPVRRRCNG